MTQTVEIYIAIGVLVIGRFLVRELRERRFAIGRIYLVPAIIGALALVLIGLDVTSHPDTSAVLAIACAAGLALGALIGYAVAHRTTVRVVGDDPSVLYARGSYATVAIWIGALLIRLVARFGFTSNAAQAAHYGQTLNAALLVLLASALFFVRYRLVVAARIERERGTPLAEPAI